MSNNHEQLDNLVSELPKTLSPKNDLWPEIEKRLDVPVGNHTNHWRTLALASIIIIGTLLGLQQINKPFNIDTNQALLASIDSIQMQHATQVAELQMIGKKVDWQSSPFSSPVETGIKQLRQAAKEIYESLKLNPTDQQLWELWLWTQSREIELLTQAQSLPVLQNQNGDTI
ncbi:hypothetical protein [Shewanella woodyi]|uniref:Uncharacterized protein n=1 Tax=Shewanella woodyi (strain ATCC 51908 / MS32) TaxID=392500 RepID=B1KDY6_SHEWM|nr:hypothetical protein [Shewanella woodyi]ACA87988.1 conserved hypothetical protein [Shewanella woodyi ATCC 51908]